MRLTPGRGTIPSPNIWGAPDAYEIENLASDRAGVIDTAINALHPWAGSRVLDIGCGSGFHLPRFASYAAHAVGIEPHLPLVSASATRLRDNAPGPSDVVGSSAVTTGGSAAVLAGSPAVLAGSAAVLAGSAAVLGGSAEALPVADASVDLVHARWAYFFGPGCEPGLAEVERVLRPGGVAAFVDNDVTSDSTFSRWFATAYPAYDPTGVERFWRRQGFTTERLVIEWTFANREDLAEVLAIEFPPETARRFLTEHEGLTVDYAIALRHKRF